MMLTGEQRYRQACKKADLIADQQRRQFMAGKIEVLPMNARRKLLIAELDRAYAIGIADGKAQRQG